VEESVFVTETQIIQGYTATIKKNNKLSFYIKNENHSITLEDINSTHATFIIQSNPFKITLFKGQTKELDLNYDRIYDLLISLEDIVGSEAKVSIKTIRIESAAIADKNITENVSAEKDKEVTLNKTPFKSPLAKALLIIILFLLIAGVTIVIYKIYRTRMVYLGFR
jgi:hypothetical protein